MVTRKEGFILEVTTADARPRVRISFPDGTVVINTDKVSITGLQKLPAVFEYASTVALRQLTEYYDAQHRAR